MSESFDWSSSRLDWARFHALANLLSLRNGGQAEPSSSFDVIIGEDWVYDENEDENAPSMRTDLVQQISGLGHGNLKQKFLDCLAEFAANKKGGTAVACSALEETEDRVVIWIARNKGFADGDQTVFDKMGQLLGSLSIVDTVRNETLLWEEMISYHRNRIEQSYIPELRARFKAYDAARMKYGTRRTKSGSSLDATLSVLRNPLFDRNLNDLGVLEKLTKLAIASYDLRRSKTIEHALYNDSKATSESKDLWSNICLLARLRVAYQVFKNIALALPSFQNISFILVPRPVGPRNPLQRPLNLNQTFTILGLDLCLATIKAVLGQDCNVSDAELEFTELQNQKLNIHAEVQMLMFFNATKSSSSNPFPYFGCSKLTCFMCNHFLQSYGRFATRGSHGRLFKPWTVPSMDQLMPGRADRITKALQAVQDEVHNKLKASVHVNLRLERTSVIKGNSLSSFQQEQVSQRQLHVDRLKMRSERDRVAQTFQRQTAGTPSSVMNTHYFPEGDEQSRECEVCTRRTRRTCSLCNRGSFCSDGCQRKSFGTHLFQCSRRPLTSADYLWRSLGEDLEPPEEEVLEDFGLSYFIGNDRTSLLGVYRGMYLSDEVSAEDLHKWRVDRILVEKIKEFYFNIHEPYRGQYFPWFLENCHVLEHPLNKEDAMRKLVHSIYDKARPYLDVEDRDKLPRELVPKAKAVSYLLLAQTLHDFSPNPKEPNWLSFGFVTCRGYEEESTLVKIYKLLLTASDGSHFYEVYNRKRNAISPATFTEFWKAYEAGKLIQLMDSKGLEDLRSELPFLEHFLSVPPTGPRPSVWDLKQFLEVGEPLDSPPIPSIRVDYGFFNCSTSEEICTLMEIYDRILKVANPMELHKACIAGELFEFAESYMQMQEQWRPLMENPYASMNGLVSDLQSEPKPAESPDTETDLMGLDSLF